MITPAVKATIVMTNCSLENPLPRTSKAWLGVALVEKMSPPKAKIKLVLSRSVGVDRTDLIPATSRECEWYHLPSNSRKGLYLKRPSSASAAVGSRPMGRRGSRTGRGMPMMELEEGRVQEQKKRSRGDWRDLFRAL